MRVRKGGKTMDTGRGNVKKKKIESTFLNEFTFFYPITVKTFGIINYFLLNIYFCLLILF